MADTLTIVRDFFEDLGVRGLTEAEILSLPVPKRKEVFLRWKWFDSPSFPELEGGRRLMVSRMTKEDVDAMANENEKKYWGNTIKFESYCEKVLKRIGVLPSDAGVDATVRAVASKFGGTVNGGYQRKDWNND